MRDGRCIRYCVLRAYANELKFVDDEKKKKESGCLAVRLAQLLFFSMVKALFLPLYVNPAPRVLSIRCARSISSSYNLKPHAYEEKTLMKETKKSEHFPKSHAIKTNSNGTR